MTFEDLKDRLRMEAQQTWDKIQESSLYISLKDRYDSLPPPRQRLAVVATLSFIALIVFWWPLSNFQESWVQVSEYETKKELIRDLLRANKEASESGLSINPPPINDVRARAEQALQALGLMAEQNRGISILPPSGGLIKSSILEGVLEVSTVQLNLKQVVDLATNLVRIPGTKLTDLTMTANSRDPRYYDAVFRVSVFKGDPNQGVGSGGGGRPPPPPPNNRKGR